MFSSLSEALSWDPKNPKEQFSLLINTGSAGIFTFSLLDSCGFERIQVLAGCQGIQITSQAAHCPECATAVRRGEETLTRGRKPSPALIVTLPGRPRLFVKFESFLAPKSRGSGW